MLERLVGIEGVPGPGPGPAGGVLVSELARAGRWSLPAVLELAQCLAHVLAAVHRRGVVHKNLSPSAVQVSDTDGKPTLIDFQHATTFAEERPAFVHHSEIVGALVYLAPEQTGRTGRPVDQRADLYALGVIVYELMSGRLPFEAGDQLQLVHYILARTPTPLAELDARIPRGLSDIVMRLLEKEPDRRYQSAEGLAHDLSVLGDRLARCVGEAFPLGARDYPLRLSAPSRLIGRDTEIVALREAFESALQGDGRGVLVAGAPGVGKTALVNELRPIVTERRGWFVAGKFDQVRRDLASDAVNQVMRGLGRLLLAEPEAELTGLRAQILRSLGPNAGLLAAMSPELALLLGVAPERAMDDPTKAEGRLIRAGLDLLRAIASPVRPVVLVLDDLQWAASVPIRFIDAVLMDETLAACLLVGAYRDAEVDAAHPLSAMLSRWARADAPPPVLRLDNLGPADLSALLAETLRLAPAQATALAEALGARTVGNPYDTLELVNALRRDGALAPSEDGWRWDAAAIRRHVGQGDVVDLLAARIEALPAEARTLLEILACLGGEVALELLQAASGLSAAALEDQLVPALEDGLLVMDQGGGPVVRFRHDRVQQTAHGRVTPEARRGLHLALARRLAASPGLGGIAAEQYLPAVEAVQDPDERRAVVALFQGAAAGARLINYSLAERFLSAAVALLDTVATPDDAALFVALETERHAALYRLGRLDDADELYRSIDQRGPDTLALAEAARVQISSMSHRGRPGEAVAIGLPLLARLGLQVPERDFAGAVARRMDAFHAWIAAIRPEDALRPEATDPGVRTAAKVIDRLMAPAYFHDRKIHAWLVQESQRLWAAHGPCSSMVANLAPAMSLTVAHRQDYRTGYTAVRYATEFGDARGYEPHTSYARFLFALLARHWFEPLEGSIRQAQLAQEGLVRGGDLHGAAHAYFALVPALFDCSPSLDACADEIESGLGFARRTSNAFCAGTLLAHRQLVRALRGDTASPGSFTDRDFDEADHLAGLGPNRLAAVVFHVQRALSAAVFGDAAGLIQHIAAAEPLLPVIEAFYLLALARVLQCLALAERARTASPEDRTAPLAELEVCRDWLASRAVEATVNFNHLLHLVDAERAWAAGEFRDAASAFDVALREASACARPWHRALISERAAVFHLDHGLERAGRGLLAEAYAAYRDWGATGKLQQLESAHPFLRGAVAPSHPGGPSPHGGGGSVDAIDMLAVLRASQALSSETHIGRLKARVIAVLGALTGATAIQIAMWRDEPSGWFLSTSADDTAAAISVEDAGARALLLPAFRYAERTARPLVVEDATRDDRFARDPYLAGVDCCSLLVVPVLSKGVVRAVLLLENRLSRGAFSADRLDAVALIAGQLVISLENALLYEELEGRVEQRTRELRAAQAELVATARKAGMAEIATNVLHNVGNVLNSVNIAASVVSKKVRSPSAARLARAAQLMLDHADDLGDYVMRDPRGKQLPAYLATLARTMNAEQQATIEALDRMTSSVDHIKDIVATQQSYAGVSSVLEETRVSDLIEDALRMNAGALARHDVTVVRQFADLPVLLLDKLRVLQILVNLISNAKYAMDGVADRPHTITLRADSDGSRALRVQVIDDGEGIPAENLSRIFAHGFTTRKGGHGFGLHSCIIAAQEMGATLTVESAGVSRGATFTLELPLRVAGNQP